MKNNQQRSSIGSIVNAATTRRQHGNPTGSALNFSPDTHEFWNKLGIPIQYTEQGAAYDGTITKDSISDSAFGKKSAAKGADSRGQTSPDSETSGGSFSRRAKVGGLEVAKVQSVIDRITAKYDNGPKVHVVQSTTDLPVDAPSDAKGMYYKGQVWIVAENNSSALEVSSTYAHEAYFSAKGEG